MMAIGQGIRQDDTEAANWYRKAAEQGVVGAQFNLGTMYVFGQWRVLKRLRGSGRKWFRKAADQGYVEAQYNLGVSYRDGQGVAQDFQEALTWFAKAADRGYSAAQFSTGLMYSDGQGVPADIAKAVTWFRKSADQDYPPAEFNMGVLYAAGMGVPRDLEQAVEWYRKAAESGLPQAQDALRSVADTGLPSAQHVLGMTWELWLGKQPKNEPEAVSWYRKAAEQGLSSRGVRSGADAGRRPGCAEEWGRGRSVVPAGRRKRNTRGATETGDVWRAQGAAQIAG